MLRKWVIGLGMLALFPAVAWGQQDARAREVLDAMSAKYAQVTAFRADISQNLNNDAEGLNETMQGSIVVKGDMFTIKMGPQEIANNGKKVFVYLEEVNEITVDYYYPEDGDISPSKIFEIYKEGYKYELKDAATVKGVSCHIIDLYPTDNGSQFHTIRLAISKSDLSLIRYEMFDRNQTRYRYDIDNLRLNVSVSDNEFQFNATTHPGADVVDMTDY